MASALQLLLGAGVLWLPGLAWTLALVPELDRVALFVTSVVAAATIQPAAMYLLNVFFGVPVTPLNVTLLSLGLASLGLAVALAPRLEDTWHEPSKPQ